MTKSHPDRLLIVDDDWMQASDLARQFSDCGMSVVGPATSLTSAMRLAPEADLAILDINVSGQMVFPVADMLIERGVPIVFYSAFRGAELPERFREIRRLEKPAPEDRINAAVQAIRPLPGPAEDEDRAPEEARP